jgi:pyrimidine-specific ribonucleoside hydrolase
MNPFIIDTDMALDDWMAILYLLRHPAAAVQAICVSGTGEAHARPGAHNALHLAALAGGPPCTVAAGKPQPLKGSRAFPWLVRFIMDNRFFLPLPRLPAPKQFADAVQTLDNILRAADRPVTILAVGPLTNLGAALQAAPELAGKIEKIVIMGGALDVPGNIQDITPRSPNAHAEWNIYIDPHAANLVFASGAPVVLVPLDVTNQVPLTESFLQRLQQRQEHPAARFVYRGLSRMHGLSRGRGFYFWDPLAAALAVRPELGRYEARKVTVEEAEGSQYGRTCTTPEGFEIQVCTGVDQAAFEQEYLDILCAQ